jgi:hypothetical protein
MDLLKNSSSADIKDQLSPQDYLIIGKSIQTQIAKPS